MTSKPCEPVLSVIIACFNDGLYLKEAIASAKLTKRGEHEIVVVNDGSTDPLTLEVLQQLREDDWAGGLRVIDQQNSGPAAARNRGIAAARGSYLLPLDADNRIKADYITEGIDILNRMPSIEVVYSDAEYFGQRTGRWVVPAFDLRVLLTDNYIDTCAVYRRSAWLRCGGYDEHRLLRGREDWDFWLRVALTGGQFHHIAKPLFEYRVRPDSLTSKVSSVKEFEAARRYIYAKRIELTIGEYAEPQSSLDFVLALVRHRPIHAVLALLGRAFLPSLFKPLTPPSLPNERLPQVRDLNHAQD